MENIGLQTTAQMRKENTLNRKKSGNVYGISEGKKKVKVKETHVGESKHQQQQNKNEEIKMTLALH